MEKELPFECKVGTKDEVVANRFSGETCTLSPDAVAVYDTIIGCEMVGDYSNLEKGLNWFREHYAAEYMVLLD